MAAFERSIRFVHILPTPEHICDQVSHLTGLAITLVYWPDEAPSGLENAQSGPEPVWVTFQHPHLKTPCIAIFASPVIFLHREQRTTGYLEWVTTAALIDLGGQCSVTLPWYARLPWRERKWWQRIPR